MVSSRIRSRLERTMSEKIKKVLLKFLSCFLLTTCERSGRACSPQGSSCSRHSVLPAYKTICSKNKYKFKNRGCGSASLYNEDPDPHTSFHVNADSDPFAPHRSDANLRPTQVYRPFGVPFYASKPPL
jgi:hypothetical protein